MSRNNLNNRDELDKLLCRLEGYYESGHNNVL